MNKELALELAALPDVYLTPEGKQMLAAILLDVQEASA